MGGGQISHYPLVEAAGDLEASSAQDMVHGRGHGPGQLPRLNLMTLGGRAVGRPPLRGDCGGVVGGGRRFPLRLAPGGALAGAYQPSITARRATTQLVCLIVLREWPLRGPGHHAEPPGQLPLIRDAPLATQSGPDRRHHRRSTQSEEISLHRFSRSTSWQYCCQLQRDRPPERGPRMLKGGQGSRTAEATGAVVGGRQLVMRLPLGVAADRPASLAKSRARDRGGRQPQLSP